MNDLNWNPPEYTPSVSLGSSKEFWIAIKCAAGEKVYIAIYLNSPLTANDQRVGVGWYIQDEGLLKKIPFCDDYVLLGWAEYEPPEFTGADNQNAITTFCPKCQSEQLSVTVEDSGVSHTELGKGHWFRGFGKCLECGYSGEYSDSSL